MELVWKPLALKDRETIMDYIAKDNPLAAVELDDRFEIIAESACRHPDMYKMGRVPGTHEAVVHPHYVMIYQVDSCSLQILRILHTARQWP
ncbi:type II toxin-antitoxin system RelE/ParE family toxin [Erwinia rhapontici]|uniref:type II toxin-antitoxin system RelE/ParE family toxin n=1 Tax=Erwinia rhapontici TaxID=55212 RepID=UPI0021699E6C|nr:type II toxin-antitoxin system RelE/ParE family toxin [Erwinia rhapontici]MCS3606876.1 addiction module RelE/StbE family toxin [Erwinia rhapontici]